VKSLFFQNFSGATSDPYTDSNAIPGQSVGAHGGSTQLLTNFDGVAGQNAVEFTDTDSNGSGGYSNLGSSFYYNVTSTNGATLLNAINAVLTSPSGTTGQFIFQYDIQRLQASNVPVYSSDDGYIQFNPNDGNPPSTYTGRDRIPTAQTGFGSNPALTDYTNSQANGLFLMDNSVFPESSPDNRGYEFTVTSDGSGATISQVQLDFSVRVNYSTTYTAGYATPESFAATNIQLFQVIATPEPASLSLLGAAGAGLLLVGRKRKTA
jgi:hypothetical protein